MRVWSYLFILWIGIFFVWGETAAAPTSQDKLFPRSPLIVRKTEFWKKMFTEYSKGSGVLHDRKWGFPIYEDINVKGLRRRTKQRKVNRRKAVIRKKLLQLANAVERKKELTAEQKKIFVQFPKGTLPDEIKRATRRIRFQEGIANKFRKGVIISNSYLPHIRETFAKHNVPEALVYLPHVESSFQLHSHSKAGAKGIWQFTRSTGRLFMKISMYLDERRDPFISTEAAARLLKGNYKRLGTWPLATLAYNYGREGVRRMVRRMGTTDIEFLILNYRHRRFNFASKNFYPEFLAAWDVAENYMAYFGNLDLSQPITLHEVKLPYALYLHAISSRLNIPLSQLKLSNPSLQPLVVQGILPIPKSYQLKIYDPPKDTFSPKDAYKLLSGLTSDEDAGKGRIIIVQPGDTLSEIAERHNVSLRKLIAVNSLRRRALIFPGQRLGLPLPRKSKPKLDDNLPIPSDVQGMYVTIQRGDNLYDIANLYQVSLTRLARANGLSLRRPIIYPGRKLLIPLPEKEPSDKMAQQEGQYIIVQPGDTLYEIALRYGIRLNDLITTNGLSKRSVIYPGQKLVIK